MISLEAIRAAVVDLLSERVALPTSWSPYVVPLQSGVNYPAGLVDYQRNGDDIIYYETFDGTGVVLLDIELHIRAAPIDAQMMMDRYLSSGAEDTSIKDAFHADHTLAGAVMSCDVTGVELGPIPTDDSQDYTARIHLRVMP